ncbi:MAG: aminomethyl-transferring glycine dehydrogenase subunit GcvPA [Anaerolineales bacterium]
MENAIISYPYIPNSAPEVKQEMLRAIGVKDIEELYRSIPQHLRLKRPLNLPEPFLSEADLVRHIENLLDKNISTREMISFLGAGCYNHHVPAICDEINGRGEFLTAYAGEPYEDHGRFQALFEYESMMGELLNMDVVNVPTYDGFQAAATAIRMACRITAREQVILAGAIGKDKLSKILDYLKPDIQVHFAAIHPATGRIDLESIEKLISENIACVYLENPSYLGVIEINADKISSLAHSVGALAVVSVNPITLGVLNPPVEYGADIVCGDIQPLGIHAYFGGGHGGFIATPDDPRFVMEFPSRLFGVAATDVEGEYGFGDVAYERTSFAKREEGKEWVGTAAALWGITAGVYLALLGPHGLVELGEGIMQRTRYAINKINQIPNLKIPFDKVPHFNEFVVDFNKTDKTVKEVNDQLLNAGIFGGKDLSDEFPNLGQSALFCITEMHRKSEIDLLVEKLKEVIQ